jgi:hypothetical protein
MNDPSPAPANALTEEVFFADREKFWHAVVRFIVGGAIAIVVLLILLAYFLV